MKKPKLMIEEQIEDMKSKNITFKYVPEKEAADFLRHNNCLIYVYVRLIKSNGIKQKEISKLSELFTNRMLKNKLYFERNDNYYRKLPLRFKTISYLCKPFAPLQQISKID